LKRLLGCVGKLEPERQRLVLLAYYNGWSREQLAEKFDTPVTTVKTWLRRSLLEIRECLGAPQ
jgi:RNA polymerase sigma-70 factor (ECF subfamily)